MRSKKIALSLTCFALMALVIPSVFACQGGKVTGGGQTRVNGKIVTPAGSFGYNAMWTMQRGLPRLKGEIQYIDHTTGLKVHAHELEYLIVTVPNPPNKPFPMKIADFGGWCTVNHESGYSVGVLLYDNGEPGGNNEHFYIEVWQGWLDEPGSTLIYVGGSALDAGGNIVDPMIVGNNQMHKPMPGTTIPLI